MCTRIYGRCSCVKDVTEPIKICVVGSGNWGNTIASLVAENAKRHSHLHETVKMYVHDEVVDGKNLSDIINEVHENVKYLPGVKLPSNLVAIPDVVEAAKDADALIFIIPHKFVPGVCKELVGKIKATAIGISLIKGFVTTEGQGIELISNIIRNILSIDVSVMMGANLANEVAAGHFSESTIGSQNENIARLWVDIIQRDTFSVTTTVDMISVEIYSGLKNVVALGAGFVDGMECGFNTKAAIIRVGILEMIKFVDLLYPGRKLSTFFESCGIADLLTTCYGGRNRQMGELFVKENKDMKTLEKEHMGGQSLEGPSTAAEINVMLKSRNLESRFPVLTTVHKICIGEMHVEKLIDALRHHPEPRLYLENTTVT